MKNKLFISFAILFVYLLNPAAVNGQSVIPLLENGNSKYKIIISENANDTEKRAAEIFQTYFKTISRVNLPIISDKHKRGKYEIILGYNKHTEIHKTDIPKVDLKADGFQIETINNNLVIIGGSQNGLILGVFHFLEQYLDCRMYTSSVIIVPEKQNINIPEIHDYQVPAFSIRDVHYKDTYKSNYAEWHGLTSIHESVMGLGVHSFDRLVPPEEFFDEHPEYYSLIDGKRVNKSQLCLTNKKVVDVAARKLQALIDKNPDIKYWGVGQNDNNRYCQCDKCRAINEKNGSQSGTILYFVNQIAKRFPDKTIVTLAYQYSREAPKQLKPAENVNIFLCSIECDRGKSIIEDPQSKAFRNDIESWGKITKNVWVWDYVVHFKGYVSPFPNLHVLQPNIQLFAKNNVDVMFQQGDLYGGGEFAELKAYLIAKLLWNPYVDIDSVKSDFLTGYYGNAAIYIEQYIDILQDATEFYGEKIHHNIDPLKHTNGYLSPVLMHIYHHIFDRAELAVINDSTLLKRVKIARLPIEYIDLEIAKRRGKNEGGFFTKDVNDSIIVNTEMVNKLKSFVRICKESGVDFLKERKLTPDEYLETNLRSVKLSALNHLATGCSIQSNSIANPEFENADFRILTDGFRGSTDCSYAWLGFGDNLELVLDLGEIKEISSVQPEFLFDQKRWKFLPDYVTCAISKDGKNYTEPGKLKHNVPLQRESATIKTFDFKFKNTKTRYIKIFAKNIGVNPKWHRFSGGNASIFIDEIIVN